MGLYTGIHGSRRPRLVDLAVAGLAVAIAYAAVPSWHGRLGLLAAVTVASALGVEAYREGLDPYRLRFSMGLGFMAIYGGLYIGLALFLGLTGASGAAAVALSPFVAAVAAARLSHREQAVSGVGVSDRLILGFAGFSTAYLTLFLLIPLGLLLAYSLYTTHGLGFDWFIDIVNNPDYVNPSGVPGDKAVTVFHDVHLVIIDGRNYGIILNSLINSTIVTIATTVLGTLVAAVMARYDFPGKTVFRVLVLIPMLVTPFINAYAIKTLMGPGGLLGMVTRKLFGYRVEITGFAGVTLAEIMAFYPIVYLNAFASFVNIDPSMEEQAENLGARGFRKFLTVTLPLALPGIMAGSTLVFIYSLEDLGAPIVFQQWDMMSPTIYHMLLTQYGQVMPEIAALGVILLSVALTGFLSVKSFVGLRQYAMTRQRVGGGGPRRLGWKGVAAVYLGILPLVLITAYPQIAVALIAFNAMAPYAFKLQLGSATLEYMEALFRDPDIFVYIKNTFIYASIATAIILVLALTTAYAAARGRRRVLQVLDAIATLPLAVPGLVVAVGYFLLFSWLAGRLGVEWLDPTNAVSFVAAVPIIIAFSVRKLPFAARAAYAGLQQLSVSLEEAAMNLGASRARVLATIVLPLVGLSLFAGAMISFIYCATEVSVSVTLGNINEKYAPMTAYMLNQFVGGSAGNIPIVASMGVLLMLIQLTVLASVTLALKQRYSFIGL
jgi:iron(III) transport system permease protein